MNPQGFFPEPPYPQNPLRPTIMEVDLGAMKHNLASLRSHCPNSKIMAVVKANAYGHGLIPCAYHLERLGIDYFGVAFLEEGIALRSAGIRTPILVFGGVLGSEVAHFIEHDLDITASSIDKLSGIDRVAHELGRKARVHLKIDTGMERIGVHSYSAASFLAQAKEVKNCEILGIFSHLARAEEPDLSFTRKQLEIFLNTADEFRTPDGKRPLLHIANTAALIRSSEFHLDMVRPGLGIYGVYPDDALSGGDLDLRPVMTLKSKVVFFKVVKQGAGVSYGHRWHAPCDTRAVTVGIGYGDGFFRRLSNIGSVIIRGNKKPIVGSVCMDQFMVDLGPSGESYVGDDVVLIGSQGDQQITASEIAQLIDTVPHEVLTATNLRVPRRYIGG